MIDETGDASRSPPGLKLLQGNPGKRPIERDPVAPETKIPPCPAHLDAVARKEFTRVAAELHKLGMVSEVSMAALAVYAARPPISELCDPSGVIPRAARALAGPRTGAGVDDPMSHSRQGLPCLFQVLMIALAVHRIWW